MSFCIQCGKKLNDDAKFCTGCGTKQAPVPVAPVAESAPVAPAPVAQPQAPKANHTKLILAIVALMVAIGCAVGGYFLLTGGQEEDPEEVEETEEVSPEEESEETAESTTTNSGEASTETITGESTEATTDVTTGATTEVSTTLSYQEALDMGEAYLLDGNYPKALFAFETAIGLEPMTVDAYMGLADVYVDMGNVDTALDMLEQVYAAVPDAIVLEKIEEISALVSEGVLVDTPYYHLTLPESWAGDYVLTYNYTDYETTGAYFITFEGLPGTGYEDYGAHFFTLSLETSQEYAEYLPGYEDVGVLITGEGIPYYMIVRYPTDVQYTPEFQERYAEMYAEIHDILGTIETNDGCYFDMNYFA